MPDNLLLHKHYDIQLIVNFIYLITHTSLGYYELRYSCMLWFKDVPWTMDNDTKSLSKTIRNTLYSASTGVVIPNTLPAGAA
jgi:hypothetical protein